MRYALTRDWSLDGGLRGSASDDVNGHDSGATAYLGVSRSFTGTF